MDFSHAELDAIEMVRPVVVRALDWPAKFEANPHFHNSNQIVFASTGIMDVVTPAGVWVVPPQRAVWVPAEVPHVIRANTPVRMRTVYLDPSYAPWMPNACCVLNVPPLLRELILKSMELPPLYPLGGANERLLNVLVDEISGVSGGIGNLHLPQPKDPRVRKVVAAILEDPADTRTRDDWAQIVSASSRTIDRIFMTETGMSFGAWKRQAVLLESMRRLAAGQPVTTVAFDVGYDSPSAFIAMFRRTFGITPSKFFG